MSNPTISILGCGWLGKALGSVLAKSGYTVMGSTTTNDKIPELRTAGIEPVVLRVNELPSGNFDPRFFNADILLISLPHRSRQGKAEDYLNQIKTVVHAAKRGSIKNIILISTTSVYQNLNRIVTEVDADVQNPIVKAERIVMESGLQGTVLRLAGLYGPGREPGKFLANKSKVSGADAPVNLIQIDDCINIIKTVIEQKVWNEVMNACADEHPTKKMFYTNAALALGLTPPTFSDSPGDYKIVSNEHLKKTLNYRFLHRTSSASST